jgi:macrodomain Ter protein organizer (MatP/YcbG family)
MGRYKKSDTIKAKPISISLNSKYISMLCELESTLNKTRSEVIQQLIEEKYSSLNRLEV